MILKKLSDLYLEDMLALQRHCIDAGGLFIPTSKEGYNRSFMYQNFCYGIFCEESTKLLGFCNCSIPTRKSKNNIGVKWLDPEELDFVGQVNTILVHLEYRGKGYGKQLISTVLEEFRNRGMKYIYVTISPQNKVSLGLFQSFEFRIVEKREYHDTDRYILQL